MRHFLKQENSQTRSMAGCLVLMKLDTLFLPKTQTRHILAINWFQDVMLIIIRIHHSIFGDTVHLGFSTVIRNDHESLAKTFPSFIFRSFYYRVGCINLYVPVTVHIWITVGATF